MYLKINESKCKLCGACEKDCVRGAIQVIDGRVCHTSASCLECWHCIAVCPTGAVEQIYEEGDKIEDCTCQAESISLQSLMKLIRGRRSVRQYKPEKISSKLIECVLEAGKFAPTGCNRQPLSYVILDEHLENIKLRCMEGLEKYTTANPDSPKIGSDSIRKKFLDMHEVYKNTGKDMLFFNAPAVIVIVADYSLGGRPQLDAGIAAANVNLAACVAGLGCCYIGFFVTATEILPEFNQILGLGENEKVVACMTIGYPDVQYFRTVVRKPIKFKRL